MDDLPSSMDSSDFEKSSESVPPGEEEHKGEVVHPPTPPQEHSLTPSQEPPRSDTQHSALDNSSSHRGSSHQGSRDGSASPSGTDQGSSHNDPSPKSSSQHSSMSPTNSSAALLSRDAPSLDPTQGERLSQADGTATSASSAGRQEQESYDEVVVPPPGDDYKLSDEEDEEGTSDGTITGRLSALTVPALRDRCKTHGIAWAGMRKAKLIEVLLAAGVKE